MPSSVRSSGPRAPAAWDRAARLSGPRPLRESRDKARARASAASGRGGARVAAGDNAPLPQRPPALPSLPAARDVAEELDDRGDEIGRLLAAEARYKREGDYLRAAEARRRIEECQQAVRTRRTELLTAEAEARREALEKGLAESTQRMREQWLAEDAARTAEDEATQARLAARHAREREAFEARCGEERRRCEQAASRSNGVRRAKRTAEQQKAAAGGDGARGAASKPSVSADELDALFKRGMAMLKSGEAAQLGALLPTIQAATNEVDTAQRVGLLDGEVEAAKSQAKHRAHYQLDRAHGRSAEELRARQAKELQALRVAHRRRAEANTKARAMEKAALHEDYGRKGACDAPACVRSSHPAYLRYHLSDTIDALVPYCAVAALASETRAQFGRLCGGVTTAMPAVLRNMTVAARIERDRTAAAKGC